MNLSQLFCAGLLYLGALFPAPGTESSARPNVLFIAADDLNDWIGALGTHPQVQTPNLDRLATRGRLFANAHVQSPLCNPSRISLMTGLRPSTTGIYGLSPSHHRAASTRDVVTLPQHFARHGYFTASFGKVFHHNSPANRRHTNEFAVWGEAPQPQLPPKKLVNTPDPEPWMDWGAFPSTDAEQGDWRVADAAIAQLQNRPKDQPFFLAVGFFLPHVPCYVSQSWFDRFPPLDEIMLPPYLPNDRADVPDFSWRLHWKLPEPRLSWLKQADEWRPLVRAYLASIAFMDSQVGRVLAALEAQQLATNTIVVFWSDNGWHLGEKDITGKCSLWERSTRVPLIFAGPGIRQPGRCDAPVELLDLYPTLTELCDLPLPPHLEGHSLVPQLNDPHARRPWPAITTHNQNNHAVRSEHWRFIQYADGTQELYDHRTDPNEWTNRITDAALNGIVREHITWLPQTNAPPVPESRARILTTTNGAWFWEGKPIQLEELVR